MVALPAYRGGVESCQAGMSPGMRRTRAVPFGPCQAIVARDTVRQSSSMSAHRRRAQGQSSTRVLGCCPPCLLLPFAADNGATPVSSTRAELFLWLPYTCGRGMGPHKQTPVAGGGGGVPAGSGKARRHQAQQQCTHGERPRPRTHRIPALPCLYGAWSAAPHMTQLRLGWVQGLQALVARSPLLVVPDMLCRAAMPGWRRKLALQHLQSQVPMWCMSAPSAPGHRLPT